MPNYRNGNITSPSFLPKGDSYCHPDYCLIVYCLGSHLAEKEDIGDTMEEKRIWMTLCLGLLAALVVMTIFLLQNAGEIDSKRKYKELGEKYTDLVSKHSSVLRKAKDIKKNLENDNKEISEDKAKDAGKKIEQWIKETEKIRGKIQTRKDDAGKLIDDYGDEHAVDVAIALLERDTRELAEKK